MKAIGEARDRVDGRLKVTGQARYAADTPVTGVAYAVMVTSTVAKGKIVRWDAARATQEPGVLAVITPGIAPKANPKAAGGGTDRNLSLIQDDAVRYSNEPVALVVADTLDRATNAARLVVLTYEREAPVVLVEQASADETSKQSPDVHRGDLAKGLARAEVRASGTYVTPFEAHNPMEPHATIAVWQGPQELVVYDSTQGVFEVRRKLAAVFDIPMENVRVLSPFVGGGFGCKGSVWSHVALAALAAREVKRPVKLVVERGQMFGPVGFRPQTVQSLTLGATRDGTLTAIEHHARTVTSRFDTFVERVGEPVKSLYACANLTSTQRLARLDIGTPTFMRAPGEVTGSFAMESAMDELSYALPMDPVALRLKNHADVDPQSGKPWSSKSLKECYEQAARAFGWSKRVPRPASMRDGRMLVGYGMATATYPAHAGKASALARLLDDGTALVQAGSQDIGTGTYTVMTQVAADALGMPFDKVRFELGDTAMPETPTSGGSMTAATLSTAVHAACVGLRAKMLQAARDDAGSPLHGVADEQCDVEGGRMFRKGAKEQGEPYEALLKRLGKRTMDERASKGVQDEAHASRSFGAHFVEVRVDPELRTLKVARVVSALAAGRILNAKTARSQYLGGIVWGIGMALLEEMHFDPRTARVVNADLAEYQVPVNADVPDIDVHMVEEEDPYFGALGAKGIGEIGICGVAPAIANAVFHATGKRVRDLPLRLDKIA